MSLWCHNKRLQARKLKTMKCMLPVRGHKPQVQALVGRAPSEASFQLLVAAGNAVFLLGHVTPGSASVVIWPSPCVAPNFPPLFSVIVLFYLFI